MTCAAGEEGRRGKKLHLVPRLATIRHAMPRYAVLLHATLRQAMSCHDVDTDGSWGSVLCAPALALASH
jgi:hypothetical protein